MKLARIAVALAGIALAVAPSRGPTGASEKVSFPVADSVRLTGNLCRPEGSGRLPAVVLMHGCAGLSSPGNDGLRAVEALLCDAGYVTLVVDSLSARHVATVCDGQSPTWFERVADALAAKKYLSTLAYVNPHRIGLLGWSHGGSTALITWARESKQSSSDAFAAVVAYYPCCDACGGEVAGGASSPLLVFLGELDVVCPASPCESFVG